jgi:hypothetical protein
MAGAKLAIDVDANTASATAGIKALGNALEGLDATAAGVGSAAGAGLAAIGAQTKSLGVIAKQASNPLKAMRKDLPGSKEAAQIAAANAAFDKMAGSIRAAGAALKTAFIGPMQAVASQLAGLASTVAAAAIALGRRIGTAIALGMAQARTAIAAALNTAFTAVGGPFIMQFGIRLGQALMAGVVAGIKAAAAVGSAIGSVLSAVIRGVGPVVMAAGRVLGGLAVRGLVIGLTIGAAGAAIAAAVTALFAAAGGAAYAAGKYISDQFRDAVNAGLSVGLDTATFTKAMASLKTGLMLDDKTAIEALKGVNEQIAKIAKGEGDAKKMAAGLKEMGISLQDLKSGDPEKIAAQLQRMREIVGQLKPENVQPFLKQIFGEDTDVINKVTTALQATDRLWEQNKNSMAQAAAEALKTQGVYAEVSTTFQNLQASISAFGTALANATGFWDKYRAAVAALNPVLQSMQQAFDLFTQALEQKDFSLITNKITEAFTSAKEKVTAALNELKAAVVGKFDEIATAITDAVKKWGAAITAGGQAVIDAAKNLGTQIKDAILAGLAGLADQFMAMMQNLANRARNLFTFGGAGGGGGGGGPAPQLAPQRYWAPYQVPVPTGLRAANGATALAAGGLVRAGSSLTGDAGVVGLPSAERLNQIVSGLTAVAAASKAVAAATNEAKTANDNAKLSVEGIAAAYTKLTTENKATNETIAQLIQKWNEAAAPGAVFAQEIANIELAMKTGKLTAEGYTKAMADVKKRQAEASGNAWAKAPQEFAEGLKSWGDSAASALADAIVEGKNLNEVFLSLIKSLAKMALETLVLKPLFASLTGAFTGGFAAAGVSAMRALPMQVAPQTGPMLRAGEELGSGSTGLARPAASSVVDSSVTNNLGAITMNFGQEYSKAVDADSAAGEQFGARVQAIIQRELVTQSRPGGILRQRAA